MAFIVTTTDRNGIDRHEEIKPNRHAVTQRYVTSANVYSLTPDTKFEVVSSSSFVDIFDRIPNILEVTCLVPRHFWGKVFMNPVSIQYAKLWTKFEVSSSNIYEHI